MSELVPYAEPVRSIELQAGVGYFLLSYLDRSLKFPEVKPLVYLGVEEPQKEEVIYVFQDAASYFEVGRYDAAMKLAASEICRCDENGLNSIFTLEKLIDELCRCRGRPPVVVSSTG